MVRVVRLQIQKFPLTQFLYLQDGQDQVLAVQAYILLAQAQLLNRHAEEFVKALNRVIGSEPDFLDFSGHSLDPQWPMVPGVFRRYILKFAIVFVLYPGIEIMLVGEAVPEMVEWVEAGLAENGHAEVDKAGPGILGDENIVSSLQVTVCHATLMN